MFEKREEGKITFYYNNEDLFNDVGRISSYIASSIVTESGIDRLSISEDEMDLYDVCVKQTLPKIHERLISLCNGITNAFNISENIEITINDNKSYNENILPLIDSDIADCLRYGILSAFYSINTDIALKKMSQETFMSCMSQMNNRLFQLKKKKISSLL